MSNEVTIMAPGEPEDNQPNLPAVRPKMEVGSPIDMPTAEFAAALDRRKANRKVLIDWVREALVDGVDFGSVSTKRGPSKPSLRKPGAEKICGMLAVTAVYPTLPDFEKAALAGVKIESIILRCELLSQSGAVLAHGIGARNVADDDGDLNKALKMAKKSAMIDATLQMAGLSEIFTQDIEDMPNKGNVDPAPPKGKTTTNQAPVTPPKPGAPWDMNRFEAYCLARLVQVAKANWAWWKYAAESRWMLPTETMDVLVSKGCKSSVNIFDLDPNATPEVNRDRAAKAFKRHEAAVSAMMQAMPPEEVELAQQAYRVVASQPAAPPTTAAAPKPAAPPPTQPAQPAAQSGSCPNCNSTATKASDKYVDTSWCEKCGWQWDIDGNYYEYHAFNYAICPIPPKGVKKKDYVKQTLGQIGRTDSKRWFGLIMNVTEAKARQGYTNQQGKHYPASQEEIAFGAACELAKKENDAARGETQKAPPPPQAPPPPPAAPPPPDDDVPF